MENRFATRLNRGAQSVTRKPDFIGQLAFVRLVAKSNLDQKGNPVTSIGRKTQDDSYTVTAQYLTPMQGYRTIKLVFPGILAEQAVSKKVIKGSQIRFTGLVQAHVDTMGQIDRRPYVVVESFELLPTGGIEEVPAQ